MQQNNSRVMIAGTSNDIDNIAIISALVKALSDRYNATLFLCGADCVHA